MNVTSTLRKRAGISLLELLVSVSIVGVLLSLILPAVQAARESARRRQSTSQLKQLGLAIHNFHDAFRKLPTSEPVSSNGTPQPHGWLVYVLPYLEQQQLYDRYDFGKPWHDVANRRVVATRSQLFECPATPNPERLDYAPTPGLEPIAAPSDYAAITGVDPRLVSLGLVEVAGAGAMLPRSVTTWGHLHDGLSNTLLLIESAGRPQVYRRGKPFEAPPTTRTLGGGWANPASDVSLLGASADGTTSPGKYALNRTNGQPDWSGQFYSFHAGLVHTAVADGSVQSLDEEIDLRVLARLITRDGKEVNASVW